MFSVFTNGISTSNTLHDSSLVWNKRWRNQQPVIPYKAINTQFIFSAIILSRLLRCDNLHNIELRNNGYIHRIVFRGSIIFRHATSDKSKLSGEIHWRLAMDINDLHSTKFSASYQRFIFGSPNKKVNIRHSKPTED